MFCTLNTKLIQGPLAGYSCAPLRKLAWQWGRPDFCCSEMLSAKHIAIGAPNKLRYRYKDPKEGLLCVQLAGDAPDVLAKAAEEVVRWGADLIDLNCGCPQPKIRKKHYGSRLLADSQKIYRLAGAIKQAVSIPVLVKIRVDAQSGDCFNTDVAKAVEDAGVDALTVHGRHWSERYDTPVHYEDIARIKQTVTIPVIGNGDVKDTASARWMFEQTACDAIMIARASVGQPWLFESIYQELNGQVFNPPGLVQIGELFLEHVQGLIKLEGEKLAILQSRSLGKYYARGQVSEQFLLDLSQTENYSSLQALVKHYFY